MKFTAVSQESLLEGAEILKNGGIVAFPTETVYGLGADAFNPQALARVFEVKGRPHFDPLIIHIAAVETLEKTADFSRLSKEKRKILSLLAENFWPGPLSIILPKNEKIPGIAVSGLSTAAIRFPDNEAAQKLISLSTGAIAAPSANPFGALSPTRAEHVRDSLGEKIDMILDGGSSRIGVESTVIDISGDSIKILRPGGTPREAIGEKLGIRDEELGIRNEELGIRNEELGIRSEGLGIRSEGLGIRSEGLGIRSEGLGIRDEGFGVVSPGGLASHYAPGTPLFVLSRDEIVNKRCEVDDSADQKMAFLFFDGAARETWRKAQMHHDEIIVKVLSESGSMTEAASRFFEILHELDNCGASRIYAQAAPPEGLGEAINDRLRRGSFKE